MTKTKQTFTLFGQDFQVLVKESGDKRTVRVIDHEARLKKGHSYLFHEDEREAQDPLLGEATELPPRGEHVAHATQKGIQKWLRHTSAERGFEKEVEDAIETTVEFWRQEFGKAEDFKEL